MLAAAQVGAESSPEPPRRARFSGSLLDGPWSSGGLWAGIGSAAVAPRISREEGLQVPAVLRGRNLIAGTIASLPLRTIDAQRRLIDIPLLRQIDPAVPNIVTLGQTVEDLLFEGVSWWRITGFGWDGFPASAQHVDVRAVSTSPPTGYPLSALPSGQYPNGAVWIAGQAVDSAEVIRFDSPNPPVLVHAARAIRRALRFERTAELYAEDPRLLGYFEPREGADPASDDDITDLLDEWEAARRDRVTGYVPAALKYNPLDLMSPADMQLPQLQQRAALDIANAMGVDPEDLGVSTTSRTYANVTDRRQDLINQTLSPYMRAITDRLSMNDVTRRGQRVEFVLDDFMKADPKTRAEVAAIHVGLSTLTRDEVREAEGRPVLPPGEATPAATPEPTPTEQEASVPVQQSAPASVRFERATGITFDAPEAPVAFRADEEARTIAGLAVPYGPVARSGWAKWKFKRGVLKWSDTGRVKLLRDHDSSQAIGRAVKLEETDEGLVATFKVARGSRGDEALALAADGVLDGLSVGIDFEDDGWEASQDDPGVRLVTSAALREISLCAIPAFDSARVDAVKATATTPEGKFTMDPCTSCGTTHAAGAPCAVAAPAPVVQAAAAPQAPAAPAVEVAAFTSAVEAFTSAVEQLGTRLTDPQHEQRQIVPAARATVREPLTYSLDGRGHSFVHDAWVARTEYGPKRDDALARIRRYEDQTRDIQSQAFANAGNTTDQAQIIPPGYRPDLYVGQIPQGRPLFGAVSTGVIDNATPFKVPVWVGSSGLSGPNVENTGPSTGTITNHTFRTVSPTAQSGEFVISRELVDSSNPAIDQIALAAMREEYSQDTEAVIATALAAATDDNLGGGQSTEGCYVAASVGDGMDLDDALMDHLAGIPFRRFLAPNRIVASSTGFPALAKAKDASGRRLFPYLSPQNVGGQIGAAAQTLDVYGLACQPSYALTAGTDDVMVWNSVDLWAWESPLLTFRFEEKAGPESIVLNLWGYFAFQILRYTGLNAVAHTGA